MKIVFASNYYNHHQSSFSEAMYSLIGDGYAFIETMPIEQERINMGWRMGEYSPFVIRSYLSYEAYKECIRVINEADVVIAGSVPEKFLRERMKQKKLTFRYSERIYKVAKHMMIRILWHFFKFHYRDHSNPNVYLLCASAYAAGDYAKTGVFKGKAYKWGYFPEVKRYENVDSVIAAKRPVSILWVARLIGWKHPEASIRVAKILKDSGYTFELNLIGSGELENELRRMIADNSLENCVHMLGAMPPEKVREHMEQSEIFLFTSDRNEGWGAVLNESMNSGCAVVASNAIGSAPFLIEEGKNGLVYRDGNVDELTEKVKMLINNRDMRRELGKRAYLTMTEQWNAENAAKRLIELANAISSGKDTPFTDGGVCSKAE